MLSRIANNLYWAGRNIERIEQISRFVPVNYFASLDGPKEADQASMLKKLNAMAGSESPENNLTEGDVLVDVAFNLQNPSSMNSCIHLARENCRGARDLLSTELWESVNKLYHYIQSFDQELYRQSSMHEFMLNSKKLTGVCKYQVDSTLVKNQVWSSMKLGLLLERAFQVSRIISIMHTEMLREVENWELYVQYESINMLKSLEAYDMNRKFYRKPVDLERALEFLIFNDRFPRSMAYCIRKVCQFIEDLDMDEKGKDISVRMEAENLKNDLLFGSIGDIRGDVPAFISKIQTKIARIHQLLNEHYFA